ncbi:MAG: hypothetical protein ACO3EE_11830 [Flavobacteriales bacterium]
MNKLFKNSILVAMSLGVMATTSCKKREASVADEDLPEATQTESSADNSQADEMQTHVYTVVHTEVSNVEEQSFKTGGSTLPADPCAIVTTSFDTITYNSKQYIYLDSMIIDYGQAGGCTWGGRTKKGKIILTKNLKMSTVGCTMTVEFEDFYVDGHKVEGIATLENKGYANLQLTLHSTFYNGKITSPDLSKISTFETDRTIAIAPGNNRIITNIYGAQSGVNHLGVAYSAVVDSDKALLFIDDCKHPQKGVVTITSSGYPTLEVDFSGGNGACDDLAVVKINGTRYKQTLGL